MSKKPQRSKTSVEIAWDMFRLICMMDLIKYRYDKELEILILEYVDDKGLPVEMQCRVPRYEYEKVIHDLLLK